MSNDTDEQRFTLAEARREIARRTCHDRGHDFDFKPRRLMDEAPTGIICARCGWSGTITMGEKP